MCKVAAVGSLSLVGSDSDLDVGCLDSQAGCEELVCVSSNTDTVKFTRTVWWKLFPLFCNQKCLEMFDFITAAVRVSRLQTLLLKLLSWFTAEHQSPDFCHHRVTPDYWRLLEKTWNSLSKTCSKHLTRSGQMVAHHWGWFCSRFLPVNRQYFLTAVSRSVLMEEMFGVCK